MGGATEAVIFDGSDTAIVLDPAVVPQAAPDWFDAGHWRALGALRSGGGGRGGVLFIDTPAGECVWRHYRRGGAVARALDDRYLWRGRDRSRGFAEFRLLQRLRALQLPVPVAVAARVRRSGWYYRADLITRCIPAARTMAEQLAATGLDEGLAARIGATIAAFHRHGVYHADLNAHNVLVNAQGIHLIDFDRGALRPPQTAWQQGNLARLKRSLLKLGAARDGAEAFERGLWAALLRGYRRGPQA